MMREQGSVALDAQVIVPGIWPGPNNAALTKANALGLRQEMVTSILRGTPVAEAVRTCHERYVQVWRELGLPGQWRTDQAAERSPG